MKAKSNVKHRMLYKTAITPDKPIVYVIRGSQGDLLIDTAHRTVTKSIERWIRKEKLNVKWLFLTHGHYDHTYNARYLQERFGCRVIIHEKDVGYVQGQPCRKVYPSAKEHIAITAAANALCKTVKMPTCDIDYCLTDKDTDFLRSLGFDADIVMLPGHTLGSMGVLQGKVLYCGDACSAKRGDYYTAMFGEDVDAIYESEKKIFEINPLIIAPGHGQIIINERAFA